MKTKELLLTVENNNASFILVSKKSELSQFVLSKLETKIIKRKIFSVNENNNTVLNIIKEIQKSINIYLFENEGFLDVSIVFNTKKFLKTNDVDSNTLNKVVEMIYSLSDDIFMMYDNDMNDILGNRFFETAKSKVFGVSSFEMISKNKLLEKMITTYDLNN